jgi:alkanesulfonate monooxygenase SsuD/methylene tetrahydromethanopterin reductase-like flavin-dependent oxidoreductase (luciferase family)
MGPPDTVRRKAAVLRAHCVEAGRDPDAVGLTHLSTVLVGDDDRQVAELVRARRPRRRTAEQFAASVNAGTVADHVGRFRELAEAGVTEVMVRLPDLTDPAALERLGRVVAEFR